MKSRYVACMIGTFFLVWAGVATADISTPWSDNFDSYSAQIINNPQFGPFYTGNAGQCSGGQYSQLTADADYNGTGKGIRWWVGNGKNDNSGSFMFKLASPTNELWVRFYKRYASGFSWSGGAPSEEKVIWFTNDRNDEPIIYEHSRDTCWGDGDTRADAVYFWMQSNAKQEVLCGPANTGWKKTQGGSVGDGKWHAYEVHIKKDTNGSDGIIQVWIDGALKMDRRNINTGSASSWPRNILNFQINQDAAANSSCSPVDFDNIAIYTTTPPAKDSSGNAFIGLLGGASSSTSTGGSDAGTTSGSSATQGSTSTSTTSTSAASTVPAVLVDESFDSSALAGNGWYDNTSPVYSSTQTATGTGKSVQFRFEQGATQPTNGGAMRHKFSDTDSVYIRYYVKYGTGWVGSQQSYHPHEFFFLTNKDSDYEGMAYTHLTAYVEQNALRPTVAIQDGKNINLSYVNKNIVATTENRAVAGCNGAGDSFGDGSCYLSGSDYWNWKQWQAQSPTITTNAWHKVEVFMKLNSVSSGKGVADGVIQYWLDGTQLMNYKNIMFRTGQNSDMKFNQLVIAPWIGDGSPIAQTFWIDNLYLATNSSSTTTTVVPSPSGLQINTK